MENYNDLEVNIAGKNYTITSTDTVEHLGNVASFINDKLLECESSDSYKLTSSEKRNIMLLLNLGDDYIKAKQKLDEALTSLSEKTQELYSLKHDIVAMKMKYDSSLKQVEELQNKAAENAARIIRLETELKKKSKY